MSGRPRADIAVKAMRLQHAQDMALPDYASSGAAGIDLPAAVTAENPLTLAPGARVMVPTGFAFEIPGGFEGQVRPRSGLAARHGVTVLNTPGTIDSDYRGEVCVILVNLGDAPFTIERGMRIAQLVIVPVSRARVEEVSSLGATGRGGGGFGSTG